MQTSKCFRTVRGVLALLTFSQLHLAGYGITPKSSKESHYASKHQFMAHDLLLFHVNAFSRAFLLVPALRTEVVHPEKLHDAAAKASMSQVAVAA